MGSSVVESCLLDGGESRGRQGANGLSKRLIFGFSRVNARNLLRRAGVRGAWYPLRPHLVVRLRGGPYEVHFPDTHNRRNLGHARGWESGDTGGLAAKGCPKVRLRKLKGLVPRRRRPQDGAKACPSCKAVSVGFRNFAPKRYYENLLDRTVDPGPAPDIYIAGRHVPFGRVRPDSWRSSGP